MATDITQTAFQTQSRLDLRTNSTDWSNNDCDRAVDEANQIIIAKIKELTYYYFSAYMTVYYLAYQQEYTLDTDIDKILYVEDFSGNEIKPVRLDSDANGYYFNGGKLGIQPIPTSTYTTWTNGSPTYASTSTFTLTGDYTRYFQSAAKVKYYTTASPTTLVENTLSTDSTFSTTTGLTTVTLTSATLDSGFTSLQIQNGLLITEVPNFDTLSGTTDVPDFKAEWHFVIYDYIYYKYYIKYPNEGNAIGWFNSFETKVSDYILSNVNRDDAERKIPIRVNSSGVRGTTRPA